METSETIRNLRNRLGQMIPEVGGKFVYDWLVPIMQRHGAVISGGIIIQSILNETWDSSDIDIYIPVEKMGAFLQDLAVIQQNVELISAPNYHNSFMYKNNICYLAQTQIPVVAKDSEDSFVYLWETVPPTAPVAASAAGAGGAGAGGAGVGEYNPYEEIKANYFNLENIPQTVELLKINSERVITSPSTLKNVNVKYNKNLIKKIELGKYIQMQVIGIKTGIPLENVIGSFDLTFCQVLFDGTIFRTCGVTMMSDVLAKYGHLADDYYKMFNYTLYKRLSKYTKRGFTINIDFNRLINESNIHFKNTREYFSKISDLDGIIWKSAKNIIVPTTKWISNKYTILLSDAPLDMEESFMKYIIQQMLTSDFYYSSHALRKYPQLINYIPEIVNAKRIPMKYKSMIEELLKEIFMEMLYGTEGNPGRIKGGGGAARIEKETKIVTMTTDIVTIAKNIINGRGDSKTVEQFHSMLNKMKDIVTITSFKPPISLGGYNYLKYSGHAVEYPTKPYLHFWTSRYNIIREKVAIAIAPGTLTSTPDTPLIGMSVLAEYRGIKHKPLYYVKYNMDMSIICTGSNEFKNALGKFGKYNTGIVYLEYDNCDVLLAENTVEQLVKCWPMNVGTFDGKKFTNVDKLTAMKTRIKFGWNKLLNTSFLLQRELKMAMNIGLKLDLS